MFRSKFTVFFLLLVALLIGFGCGGAEENADGGSANNQNANQETVDSTVPDADFPDDDSNDDKASTGGRDIKVKFDQGASSRSYEFPVVEDKWDTYVLSAKKGQTMTVTITSAKDNAEFRIKTPSGDPLGAEYVENSIKKFSGPLPESGDYKFEVFSAKGEANYRINFAVTGGVSSTSSSTVEGADGLVTTVKFKPGASSATYKHGVVRGQVNTYIIGARKGQFCNIEIDSVENNAVFALVGPDGEPRVSEKMSWSTTLDSSGNHKVEVGTTRGGATYTLKITIE